MGLYGVLQPEDQPELHLFDRAIAECCLSYYLTSGDVTAAKPYTLTWSSTLQAPATGAYTMTVRAEGETVLMIGGQQVVHIPEPSEEPASGTITLQAGKHDIVLSYVVRQTRGDIELRWTPPGESDSIVPPSALSPPLGAGVGPPLDLTQYKEQPPELEHEPLVTVR